MWHFDEKMYMPTSYSTHSGRGQAKCHGERLVDFLGHGQVDHGGDKSGLIGAAAGLSLGRVHVAVVSLFHAFFSDKEGLHDVI